MFIVVAVTGGIAAYKSVHLVRLLIKDGHDVHVVPTEDALRFVGLPTWEAISRNPVTVSVHDDVAQVRHVSLGQRADLIVVAPATANTLAKMAAGIADNLVGTTLLATRAPVVVAPAMHTEMWQHPATVANVATLRARGVHVIGPESGELTGGDSGAGRMSEPEAIAAAAVVIASAAAMPVSDEHAQDLAGLRVVVSTGGTREPLDPVRYLGNRSSGRQGAAVALAAADRGAEVTLVAAHVDDGVLAEASRHPAIEIQRVGTTSELAVAMRRSASAADVVVMVAAVADYRPADMADRKITKDSVGGSGLTLHLVETEDVLAELVAERRSGQIFVGFAAETPAEGESLVERAARKARRKGVDLLAVNEVGWHQAFEAEDNTLMFLDAAGEVTGQVSGTKRTTAEGLWDAVAATRRNRDEEK
ncbi:bifunctional phosphopantothenoylcysteine decarboxylase/phosphopantothenate--cysteine ligase CoaBC [Microbacterium sp. C7(2022)]|uniref:bifunctional phosphopantothenoylcysteine decarboxylase/phosphopantothenate--cysteine ligase CoaBC n=1 Tax=Microbacterium sp. C7(2022) TaxID=2992759 RepID=UPI00237C183D|nr:bifunctional phosphopantothenoylcysteine decarboxylase/phosphopantothenate--cysteine ligase CoaBC [Microbacterium sp. C7(2022)]MDE0547178.1 bifunctional phosphopantothenoylcysteine decarboxylase/phosphopantothenate--cysteine ligase CoaBC [Microbacterium sp. C7(2022)]